MTTAQNAAELACFTPEQVAERLQVSVATVLFWLRMGRMQGAKLDYRTWRIAPAEIEAFLERQAVWAAGNHQEARDYHESVRA